MARAAALVATDRALRRSALVPTGLTFVGCAALASVIAWRKEGSFPEVAFATFVAVSSMPSTFLWPMWKRLGMEARRALGASRGEEERPGEPYLRTLVRESAKAVRQAAAVGIGLAPVFFVVELRPGVGHGLTVALGAAWAGYWMVLDSLEIPVELQPGRLGPGEPTWFERGLLGLSTRSRWLRPAGAAGRFVGWLARPWRHPAAFTERDRWTSAGFGLAAAAFLAVPVIGVFFRAVAITAATSLVVRDEPPPTPGQPELAAAPERA
ncbi:MAG TPA: EI24 domain-containing protein [Anaeromyxobacteraceae bacterium]|nr:EI24 domain-containing protein [Anaeromyxobacteraceae bacterium]